MIELCRKGHDKSHNKEPDGSCKICRKIRAHKHNISAHGRLTRLLGCRRRSEEKQKWIYAYLKEHPCVDCGETDPLVLQFDHLKGKKRRDVTGLTLLSIESIKKETAKCQVVCANDHARRTAKRANTIRWRLSIAKQG